MFTLKCDVECKIQFQPPTCTVLYHKEMLFPLIFQGHICTFNKHFVNAKILWIYRNVAIQQCRPISCGIWRYENDWRCPSLVSGLEKMYFSREDSYISHYFLCISLLKNTKFPTKGSHFPGRSFLISTFFPTMPSIHHMCVSSCHSLMFYKAES